MIENAQTIEIDDTVRLVGRNGKGVVTGLKPGWVEICYTFNIRKHGQGKGCSMRIGWYAAERVELVRKGNAQDDAVAALFDEIDGPRAAAQARAAAAQDEAEAREVEAADLARWKAAEEAHRARHGGDVLKTLLCTAGNETPACGLTGA